MKPSDANSAQAPPGPRNQFQNQVLHRRLVRLRLRKTSLRTSQCCQGTPLQQMRLGFLAHHQRFTLGLGHLRVRGQRDQEENHRIHKKIRRRSRTLKAQVVYKDLRVPSTFRFRSERKSAPLKKRKVMWSHLLVLQVRVLRRRRHHKHHRRPQPPRHHQPTNP